MLASTWLLFAVAVSTWPAAALCQEVSSPAGATEIWMSGNDVKITRRAPPDGGLAERYDHDEFARTMMKIAQQRSAAGDDKTATWLSQWARQLTSGRVGAHELPEDRPRRIEFAAVEATDAARAPPSAQLEETAPLAPELPQSTAPAGLSTAAFAFDESGWSADGISSQGDAGSESSVETCTAVETCSAAAVVAAEHSPHDAPRERWQAVRQKERTVSPAQPLTGDVDGTNSLPQAAQAKLTLGPIGIAFVSFASGATFCAILCVVLALVLVRARVERRAPSLGSTDVSPDLAKETVTRPPTLAATDAHGRQGPRNKPDKNGSIMESFYNHNVELYKQLAHSG